MKRVVVSGSIAMLFVLSNTGIVAATSANISPHSQSRAHGVASSWTATWGDNGPYRPTFHPDTANPGLHEWAPGLTWLTSYQHSMAFYPCTGTTFRQQLVVDDAYGSASHWSTATEGGGHCGPVLP
ncbi:MAG: hypothetical protein V4515_00800 [Chloroflexota bacterium]